MGILYELPAGGHRPRGRNGLIAGTIGEVDDRLPPHRAVAVPLVPCSVEGAADWSCERLSEDRFRLTLAARGLAEEDIDVTLEEGLLHIDGRRHLQAGEAVGETAAEIDCLFMMLEPLYLVDYRVRNGRLVVDLQRDHATPCRADLPPRLSEAATLALAA